MEFVMPFSKKAKLQEREFYLRAYKSSHNMVAMIVHDSWYENKFLIFRKKITRDVYVGCLVDIDRRGMYNLNNYNIMSDNDMDCVLESGFLYTKYWISEWLRVISYGADVKNPELFHKLVVSKRGYHRIVQDDVRKRTMWMRLFSFMTYSDDKYNFVSDLIGNK